MLIATPEYDYAIPGVLTAALDWALRSRHDPTPFRHKPVGIVGASPGGGGTVRGQLVLRQILLHPPAYVMPEPQMLIPLSRQKFDAQTGDLLDEETRDSCAASWRHWSNGRSGSAGPQQLTKGANDHSRDATGGYAVPFVALATLSLGMLAVSPLFRPPRHGSPP